MSARRAICARTASATWPCSAPWRGCAPRSARPTSISGRRSWPAPARSRATRRRCSTPASRRWHSELAILRSQALQRQQELAELQSRLAQLDGSHELALEELKITEPLAARRIVPQIDLLRLKREVNDLEGELETTRLGIERIKSAADEADRRIEEKSLSFRAEAQRELVVVQAEADALEEKIAADTDRVQRTDVRSPVRGTIKQLFVNTVGGVIQPGEDLVEIVPLEDTLLVEAKVRPADIAFLRPGQPATVKVTAYDFSIYGGLDAVVEDISADTITDEEGERFYRIRVRTDRQHPGKGRHAFADHPRHDHRGRHPHRREDRDGLSAEADPARAADGAARALSPRRAVAKRATPRSACGCSPTTIPGP